MLRLHRDNEFEKTTEYGSYEMNKKIGLKLHKDVHKHTHTDHSTEKGY